MEVNNNVSQAPKGWVPIWEKREAEKIASDPKYAELARTRKQMPGIGTGPQNSLGGGVPSDER